MPQRKLLFYQLGIVTILAALHIYAIIHFSYWRLHWLDIPTHFIAGVWAGFFAVWALISRQKPHSLTFCVGIILTIGIIWELFEAVTGSTQFPADTLDTIKDLSMDIIGGVSGVYLARLISKPML